jgi:hypothetical protein
MVYLSMAPWLDFGKGCAGAAEPAARTAVGAGWLGWLGWLRGADGRGISRARDRLGSAPPRALFEVTAKPTVPAGHDEVLWRDPRKVVVDGTVFDVSASTGSESAFDTPAGGSAAISARRGRSARSRQRWWAGSAS